MKRIVLGAIGKFTLLIMLTPAMVMVSVHADQTDVELDALFARLLVEDRPRAITTIENQIWEIWHQHSDADVEALMAAGIRRMNAQRYNEALQIFSEIIKVYPDYAEAWNKRATLYYVAGEMEASIEDIEQTLALEPRHFGALSGLGMVYLQQQKLTQAKSAFEALIKVHPNSPNAKQNLSIVNSRLERSLI